MLPIPAGVEPLALLKSRENLNRVRENASRLKLACPVGREGSVPKAILYVEQFKPDSLQSGFVKNVEAAVNWAAQLIDNPTK